MKRILAFPFLFLFCLISVKSQENNLLTSQFKVTELSRSLDSEKGLFSVCLFAEFTGGYIYGYTYEQDGIKNPASWIISPSDEIAYIDLYNLEIDRTTIVYIETSNNEGFQTQTYKIEPVTTNISDKETDSMIPSKYKVFSIDGKHKGSFDSYEEVNANILSKGIYIIQELDADNQTLGIKKYIQN